MGRVQNFKLDGISSNRDGEQIIKYRLSNSNSVSHMYAHAVVVSKSQ